MEDRYDDGLPDEAQLASLPGLACFAYAIRCLQRVMPLLRAQMSTVATERQRQSVDAAIRFCHRVAAGETVTDDSFSDEIRMELSDFVGDLDDRYDAAGGFIAGQNSMIGSALYVAAAVDAVTSAAYCFWEAVDEDDPDDEWDCTEMMGFMVSGCVRIVGNALVCAGLGVEADAVATSETQNDYWRLRRAVDELGWHDGTVVQPEFFGPFWPGAPCPALLSRADPME